MPNKQKDQPIPAAEFARLRVHLANKGCKPAEIDAAIGTAHNNRIRRIIANALIGWLKTRPKG